MTNNNSHNFVLNKYRIKFTTKININILYVYNKMIKL